MTQARDDRTAAWAAGLREGPPDAIEAFAAQALPRVVRWCRKLGGPRIDAEDAAQEVMIVALGKVQTLGPDPNLDAWLFAICRRVLANHRRKAWFKRWSTPAMGVEEMASSAIDPERATGAHQRLELAQRCMDGLSPRHREVLVLYDLEERSAAEVAEIVGSNPQAVRALAMRARRKLMQVARKAGYGPEEGAR
jgi:RNA polymerase sigma-70 factor, ECF subfamily